MTGLDRLMELQELDLAVDRLGARRREIESGDEVAEARSRTEKLEESAGELRLALDGVGSEQSRLEGEVGLLTKRIEAEERRLYDGSVANPKELAAIQTEVAGLKHRRERLEDEVLEQMVRREDLEAKLPAAEKELEEARRGLATVESSSEEELGRIARNLEERARQREALVPQFDEELLELYEDLRAQKKGVAVAALKDGVCQGCHQKLSPVELDRIKRTEGIRRCEYCRRILFPV